MKNSDIHLLIEDLKIFAYELHQESDRAAVMRAQIALESQLGDIVTCLLPLSDARADPLLDGEGAPLGDSRTRCVFLRRLRLIDDAFKKALDQIRKLRNKFAHKRTRSGSPIRGSRGLASTASPADTDLQDNRLHKGDVDPLLALLAGSQQYSYFLTYMAKQFALKENEPAVQFKAAVITICFRLEALRRRCRRIDHRFTCTLIEPSNAPDNE